MNTDLKKIRILIIGKNDFVSHLQSKLLKEMTDQYSLETISDERNALERLYHNSYDILLLEDGFSKYNTIKLSMMAYAMSKPTIIICKNIFKLFYYFFIKSFSPFFRNFQISKKLIFFKRRNSKFIDLMVHLSKTHLSFLKDVNKEIKKNTNI